MRAVLVGEFVAEQGADQLLALAADEAQDSPARYFLADIEEGVVPRQNVMEVRVDQRPVDVEQHNGLHH